MREGEGMPAPTRSILTAAAALGAGLIAMTAATAGEANCKSIGSEGDIAYSWRADLRALRVETIGANTPLTEEQPASARIQQKETRVGRDSSADARRSNDAWTRVDDEITRAQSELDKARAELEAGRAPLPVERRGNVGGHSRLTQAYFDRHHDLELAVDRAKQRLDSAYAARNALK